MIAMAVIHKLAYWLNNFRYFGNFIDHFLLFFGYFVSKTDLRQGLLGWPAYLLTMTRVWRIIKFEVQHLGYNIVGREARLKLNL